MVYEVDINIQKDNEFITLQTAWIQALNVTECRTAAKELADDMDTLQQELLLDIRELEE
ncbi:hypothetical protein ACWNS2_13930 [Planococcus plakortidis]